MRVSIFGGGNVGCAMAALIAARGHRVTIVSSRPEAFSEKLVYTDSVTGESFEAAVAVTSSARCAAESDVIFVTLPSFAFPAILEKLAPHWSRRTPLGVVPGSGGPELYLAPFLERGHTVFGLDRVPCIARLTEYGRRVSASRKESVRLAALPRTETAGLARLTEELLGLSCAPLSHYLTVTFTPSNPILHTARLYELYHSSADHTFSENVRFYEAWDDASSRRLIACDAELQALCRAVSGADLSGVVSLLSHYGVHSAESMTQKLSSIPAFRGILSPMKQRADGRFVLDTESRYFTEDFPFGLLILIGFARVFSVPTPEMDRILLWYQELVGREYLVGGVLCGRDAKDAPLPQNFGLETPPDVLRFYDR